MLGARSSLEIIRKVIMNNIFVDEYDNTPAKKTKYSYVKNQLIDTDISESAQKKLLISDVDRKNIFGYKTKDNLMVKYNKEKELFIVYNIFDKIIHYSNKSWREFNSLMYDPSYVYSYEDEL